jgi:3-oxoadipate enol-lactonase
VPPVPTVELNGIDLSHECTGAGPPLLFVNGSGATVVTSAPLSAPFTTCFDVVAHDERGLGRTAIPPGRYTMADYAADAAALLDHLEWDSCRVAGVSFGGMVAQELAFTWPERIERLALLRTSPGGAGGASYPRHELAALVPEERAATMTCGTASIASAARPPSRRGGSTGSLLSPTDRPSCRASPVPSCACTRVGTCS